MENLQELIEEAKKRFPIGCKYISAYDIKRKRKRKLYECKGNNFQSWRALPNAIHEEHSEGIIYENGVWAEITTISEEIFPIFN